MEKELQNSIEYISKKTGGKSGFTVPSNYFNNVENSFNIKMKVDSFNTSNDFEFINKQVEGKNGFTVPTNYFDTVEDSFSTKLKEQIFVKTKGFEIPDSYFDKLEDTILSKVSSTEKEVKVITLKQRVFKLIPMVAAASVVLFIGLNSFMFNKTAEDLFDNLADSDVENWISNNINLISDNDLALTYNDIEFDDSETIPNSISTDELENYLSNQNNLSLILEND